MFAVFAIVRRGRRPSKDRLIFLFQEYAFGAFTGVPAVICRPDSCHRPFEQFPPARTISFQISQKEGSAVPLNKIDRSEAPEEHSGAFLRLYLPRRTPPVPPGAGIASISQGAVPTPPLSKNSKFVPSRSCSLLQRAFERESSAFNPAKGAADFRPFRRILLARKFRLRRPAGPASPLKRGKASFYGTGFFKPFRRSEPARLPRDMVSQKRGRQRPPFLLT